MGVFSVSESTFLKALVGYGKIPFQKVEEFYLDRYGKLERYEHHIYSFSRTAYAGIHFATAIMYQWPRLPEQKHEWWNKYPGVVLPQENVTTYLVTSRDG